MTTKFILHIPTGKPLKKAEKDALNADLISSFQAYGDQSVQIADSYYESKHALPEVVTYVVTLLTAIANSLAIAKAIRDFLKKQQKIKSIRIKVNDVEIELKGDMSDKEIEIEISDGKKRLES
jgi:hypothetical protein